ncbi:MULTISPECIES: ferritin-like domain-containing protein [Streptomyces]|uniref:Ferritin-like domain-containing protein n=1 Tax=Streptomyces globisporus TaxID=1908 RepID=A0A927BLT8_STRGL|nr:MULTISPECIES: ferritin-like domain-containing protein [Streptomyces]KOG83693.1 membrane protein [Streptomyces griseus subsp. rhodochrous]MBD2830084.1 ferritin-like domain-containing protein [Streptomyces globisporus]QRV53865.1 ferritin-like domain-containing protein [Streptomyces californicus]
MDSTGYGDWIRDFETARRERAGQGDPDWRTGVPLHPAIRRSVQRFQVGEDGDGAELITKAEAAGDAEYASAVRMFVAEERNHARLLALLLASGDAPTIASHWSDRVFVTLRRALGLRLELLVLMIAEVVALRYYRALRDGGEDALTREVAGRVLADEERHVPFHCHRLRRALRPLPAPARVLVTSGWRAALAAACLVVAVDHGPALRRLGVGRGRFAVEVVRSSGPIAAAMR